MSYQKWVGYPDSPLNTETYPYQCILDYSGTKWLICSNIKLYHYTTNQIYATPTGLYPYSTGYRLVGGNWELYGNRGYITYTTLLQANNDIYTDSSLSSVFFTKTTISDFSKLTLTFSKAMADPTGKHGQFSVLKQGGGAMQYQEWAGYPNSPLPSNTYPYQSIHRYSGAEPDYLICSQSKLYMEGNLIRQQNNVPYKFYKYEGGNWVAMADTQSANKGQGFLKANNDIYTDNTLTSTYFAKNTNTIVSDSTLTINSASLNTDPTKIDLKLAQTIANTDVIKVSYTKGTVTSSDGTPLESFSNVSVSNLVP